MVVSGIDCVWWCLFVLLMVMMVLMMSVVLVVLSVFGSLTGPVGDYGSSIDRVGGAGRAWWCLVVC